MTRTPHPDPYVFDNTSEINLLAKSLQRTGKIDQVFGNLKSISETHNPFALYIATADRSSCMWIFDKNTVFDMLGGEDIHSKTFKSIFQTEEERDSGILFYVFKKIGPIVVVRLSEESITQLLNTITK